MALAIGLFVVAQSAAASPDPYTVSAFAIDNSGTGVSVGGTYSLTGTVGQASTGVSVGGSFAVDGGFLHNLKGLDVPPTAIPGVAAVGLILVALFFASKLRNERKSKRWRDSIVH